MLSSYRYMSCYHTHHDRSLLQGYLAHKKPQPPRNLQYDYAYGPTAVLGGGRFLMSEVSLYRYESYCPFPRFCDLLRLSIPPNFCNLQGQPYPAVEFVPKKSI